VTAVAPRWQPARRQAAATAGLAAAAGGSLAIAVVEPRFVLGTALLAALHVAATLVACVRPSAAAGPVLAGAAMAWPVALGANGAAWAVPVVVAVVLVGELLGAVDEHRVAVPHPGEAAFARVGAAAALAGAVARVLAVATAVPLPG
jgi:hypothetical protein